MDRLTLDDKTTTTRQTADVCRVERIIGIPYRECRMVYYTGARNAGNAALHPWVSVRGRRKTFRL